MGTKNNPGQFDCYANAEPDEPMFVLLARDRHAPTLVWLWAALRELDQEKPEKVAEARACCLNMIRWATEHDRKVVGLGHAMLAGLFDLMRIANAAVKDAKNGATDTDVIRAFLSRTVFEGDEPDGIPSLDMEGKPFPKK